MEKKIIFFLNLLYNILYIIIYYKTNQLRLYSLCQLIMYKFKYLYLYIMLHIKII